jgi:hypothetical protein
LFLLCLLNIEQYILMYACNKAHLLEELCSYLFYIDSIIHHTS